MKSCLSGNDKERDNILKSLNKASKFIMCELCKRVEIRKMIEIRFVYDESTEYGEHIDEIIEEIHAEANE